MSQASILQPGVDAPEFTLEVTPEQRLSLSDFRGRPVILAFYPADWSPVCSDQLSVYSQILDEFRAHDAQLLAISTDGVWCHLAFARERRLSFPLLSDWEPKGAVGRAYGVYDAKEGVCERALFVIDRDGTIAWSYLSPIGINPGADGILAALERLRPSEPRPAKSQRPEARP
jgi:peroxiredoxin